MHHAGGNPRRPQTSTLPLHNNLLDDRPASGHPREPHKTVRFPCTTICWLWATLLSSNTGIRNSGNQYEKCTADLHVAQSRAEAFRTPTRWTCPLKLARWTAGLAERALVDLALAKFERAERQRAVLAPNLPGSWYWPFQLSDRFDQWRTEQVSK
jgi:hypothetical protein